MRRTHEAVNKTWRRPATTRLLGLVSAIYLVYSGGAFAALHCEQPADAVTKKICSYTWEDTGYTLEDLDTSLNLIYQAAMDRVVDRDKLRKEQRAWIKVRDKCEGAKCFNDMYDARIRELAVIPGKSAANLIAFFGPDMGAEDDPKVIEAKNNRVTWLLSRSGGLKYFDGGVDDFDIVGKGKPGTDRNVCSYTLFGLGKTFSSSCQEPTSPDGNPLRMTPFPGDRREGFDAEHEPAYKSLTANGIELASVKGEKLLTEASGAKCEPFDFFLEARAPHAKKALWKWVYFYESPVERTCSFSNKVTAPQVRFKNSLVHVDSALLPGGDMLVGAARINPRTGLPRDRTRVAVVTQEQAIGIKRKLLDEYLAANPVCRGKAEFCPEPAGAVSYLWQQLNQAMKPFYLQAK